MPGSAGSIKGGGSVPALLSAGLARVGLSFITLSVPCIPGMPCTAHNGEQSLHVAPGLSLSGYVVLSLGLGPSALCLPPGHGRQLEVRLTSVREGQGWVRQPFHYPKSVLLVP